MNGFFEFFFFLIYLLDLRFKLKNKIKDKGLTLHYIRGGAKSGLAKPSQPKGTFDSKATKSKFQKT